MKSIISTIGLTGRMSRSVGMVSINPIFSRVLSMRATINLCSTKPSVRLCSSPLNGYKYPILHASKAMRAYSTATAPPPPPPSSDKNAKGKRILTKINRAFTFSLASILVIAGTGVALLVVYLILSELFLPSGDTRTFNKAVKLVEKNEKAQLALGFAPGSRLKAYGEYYGDNWVRNRPVHGLRSKGKDGKDHLLMKFHVEADNGKHGSVVLEQVDSSYWSSEFSYIALDIPGQKRIWIIEPKWKSKDYIPKLNNGSGFLGLKWGPKKDD